jgi:hypothetical protein
MKISIQAWKNGNYVSLADLLRVAGSFLAEKKWYAQVNEVAPEPGADQLEKIDPGESIDFSELLQRASPNTQLVDGEIFAMDGDYRCLLIRAVDSTSWDIESDEQLFIDTFTKAYPDAIEIPEQK